MAARPSSSLIEVGRVACQSAAGPVDAGQKRVHGSERLPMRRHELEETRTPLKRVEGMISMLTAFSRPDVPQCISIRLERSENSLTRHHTQKRVFNTA